MDLRVEAEERVRRMHGVDLNSSGGVSTNGRNSLSNSPKRKPPKFSTSPAEKNHSYGGVSIR